MPQATYNNMRTSRKVRSRKAHGGMAARDHRPSSPILVNVRGAPFHIGQAVRVRCIADTTLPRRFVGRRGLVKYLEYGCGCGQSYPHDPMVGVRLSDGAVQEFWREELARLR